MKGCRDRTQTMADPVARAPFPSSAAAQLSGQELEAWLEDLESVLYPSLPPPPPDPSRESPGLKQLWLEDIESVFYPPVAAVPGDPAAQTQKLSQLLLDNLESILYPPAAGDPSENAGHQPPDLTQVEFGSEDHTPLTCPLVTEGGPSDRPSTVGGGQREDAFAAPSPDKRGAPGGDSEGGNPELVPRGGKSRCLPGPPPARRGTKRRHPGGCCPCGRPGTGATEPEVARLTAENALLRRRIEELTAEVGEARARLIERMVSAR